MKSLAAILLGAFSVSALSEPAQCPLQGVWKSDAARTLADIAANHAMSPRGMSAVSNDFFGHMIHEWTCTELRAWFDYQERPKPMPYHVVESSSESLMVAFPDEPLGDLRIIFEGNCYKIRSEAQKYHEYFCPVQPYPYTP